MEEKNRLLKQAINEITRLRQQNSNMSGRLDMFDKMMLLFQTRPDYGQGQAMSPDIIYELQRSIDHDSPTAEN